MSHFSDVDASGAAVSLADYLRATDRSMSAFKAYVATAAQLAVRDGLVVDVGCGLGGDLARLRALGVNTVGVDASATFLATAATTGAPVLQGDAAALPFRNGSVDGVRSERTLQHVADPGCVLDEMARVLRPGGWVAILEPDFRTFRVDSDGDNDIPARFMSARHPDIGGRMAGLLDDRGFRVRDIVTESSRGYALDDLPIVPQLVFARAIAAGRFDEAGAAQWFDEQRQRSADGTFLARWDKVLVVATKN